MARGNISLRLRNGTDNWICIVPSAATETTVAVTLVADGSGAQLAPVRPTASSPPRSILPVATMDAASTGNDVFATGNEPDAPVKLGPPATASWTDAGVGPNPPIGRGSGGPVVSGGVGAGFVDGIGAGFVITDGME